MKKTLPFLQNEMNGEEGLSGKKKTPAKKTPAKKGSAKKKTPASARTLASVRRQSKVNYADSPSEDEEEVRLIKD